MQDLMPILRECAHDLVTRSAVATQNHHAARADAEALTQAVDRRAGHIEFSTFAPNGRA